MIDVDLIGMTATTRRNLIDTHNPLYSWNQGNTQPVDSSDTNGNVLLAYGSSTIAREFDPTNAPIQAIQFGEVSATSPSSNYRVYKYAWSATPSWPPSAVAQHASNGTSVHMSWNGATDYDNWAVYGGYSPESANTTFLGTTERTGFETVLTVDNSFPYISATAQISDLPLGSTLPIQVV